MKHFGLAFLLLKATHLYCAPADSPIRSAKSAACTLNFCNISAHKNPSVNEYEISRWINLLQAVHEGHSVPEKVIRAHFFPAVVKVTFTFSQISPEVTTSLCPARHHPFKIIRDLQNKTGMNEITERTDLPMAKV